MTGKIESLSKKAVNEYIKKISKFSPYQYYYDFINDENLFNNILNGRISKVEADFLRESTLNVLNSGYLEIEDVAPIIYLKYSIYGMEEKLTVKHIVIDEGQDFSVFQLYVLKRIVKDSSFTILGDLCQSIHSYRGIKRWEDVIDSVFDDRKCEFLTLEKSYRTTVEIMEAANKVISKIKDRNMVLGSPVIRHGEKVNLIKKDNMKDILESVIIDIKRFEKEGFKSIAIVCKTIDACRNILFKLKKDLEKIDIISGKEDEYKSGLVVVPSYLTKGLEFDIVMIINQGEDVYREDELDIKLLYVSMTRALHKLYIYYDGQISPLLEGV